MLMPFYFECLQIIMSVEEFNKARNIAILDHRVFLLKLYRNLQSSSELLSTFEVKTPFRMDLEADKVARGIEDPKQEDMDKRKRKKRKRNLCLNSEAEMVQNKFLNTKTLVSEYFPGAPTTDEIRENNKALRKNVSALTEKLTSLLSPAPSSGQNHYSESKQCDGILYPPQSSFSIMDISDLDRLGSENKYDIILMDPPWTNKHVKRIKNNVSGYSMVENEVLEDMELGHIMTEDGVVVVWVTNKERHRESVRRMFSKWGVSMAASWYWVKVTVYGELICDFSEAKQPYEVCFIGTKNPAMIEDIPDNLLMISVPSGIHSHKPPLNDLLKLVLATSSRFPAWEKVEKLELFGRSLQPGWRTIGNQSCLMNFVTHC